MKLTELYSEYFANWVSGGNLIVRDKISLLGIKPLYDRFVTNGYITKIWCITGLPVHYDNNLTQAIRTEMFELCPDVKTVVSTINNPVQVNPRSEVFTRQLKRAASSYSQYKEIFDSLDEADQLTGAVEYDNHGHRNYVNAEVLHAIKDLYDSYSYVFEKSTHNMEFTETCVFIQASAKSRSALRKYKKSFVNFMTGQGIEIIELKGNINQYLNNYCPAAYVQTKEAKIRSVLLSAENLAAITNYKSKGLVGDKGALIAQDWQTHLPFMQDFFHSGAAQVVMLLAGSGWGKTRLAYNAAMSIMGYRKTRVSAIDIKGGEWDALLQFTDGVVLDMDKGMFVNTMRLDDLTISEDEAEEFFNLAVKDTVQFYKLVINLQPNEGNETDLEDILNAAVLKMYNKRDVSSNLRTFSRTADMHYSEIVDILETLKTAFAYTEEQKKICSIAKTRCAAFFISETGKGAAMTHAITVNDVINTPLTIYSFNKNSNADLDLLDSLRVFMVQTLDNRVAMLRKRKGLFTAAFYEELQRCTNSGSLIRYISGRVTGSRSDNLIIFLLLNSISAFDAESLAQIKSNITTYMIGEVKESDAKRLVTEFDCADIEHYISAINHRETEYYRNCFAVKFDTGYKVDRCIIKALAPADVNKALQTRTILDD